MKKLIYIVIAVALCGCSKIVEPQGTLQDPVKMTPEYRGATFPVNIAAPSFILESENESITEFAVQLGREGKTPDIQVKSGRDGKISIPLKKWRKLLESAKGGNIYLRVLADEGGQWKLDETVSVSYVSPNPIDEYLCYRLLYPGYELWNSIGIYERNLTNYEQKPILENKDFDRQCINCHNFSAGNPEQGLMIHVRGPQGGTLISRNGNVEKINSRFDGANHGATYPGWSPDGKFIAFSANDIGQVFHSSGTKPIEVVDRAADLMVYNVDTHQAYSDSSICGGQYIETFPNWGPDSRTLYFCRANAINESTPLDSVHYDLCSIRFDPQSGCFSDLKVLYAAAADSASVSFPRCSPDGRWLMFTRSSYGNFSIWHPEADLCVMDLKTNQWRKLDEVNSSSIESYHSWDSSGRWFVFSSKRMDGLWARPYIAAFDPETGRASVPFCLPQKSPEFYQEFTRTFNIPELIKSPVVNTDALLHGIISQQPQSIELRQQ